MLQTSEKIDALAGALAKAQAEMGGAVKDAANPFFKSKYADLASVRDACLPALTKHELCVIQGPSAAGSTVAVETMLAHSSGQWIRETLTATAKDESPQAIGSTITYLRRYGLQSIAGVAPEDDDGEAAQGRQAPQHAQRSSGNGHAKKPDPPPPAVSDPITSDQRDVLLDVARSAGLITGTDASALLALCTETLGRPVKSSKDIGAADLATVMAAVELRAGIGADVEQAMGA